MAPAKRPDVFFPLPYTAVDDPISCKRRYRISAAVTADGEAAGDMPIAAAWVLRRLAQFFTHAPSSCLVPAAELQPPPVATSWTISGWPRARRAGGRPSCPPGRRFRRRRLGSRCRRTAWPRAPSRRLSSFLPAWLLRLGSSPSPPLPSYRLAAGVVAPAAAFVSRPAVALGGVAFAATAVVPLGRGRRRAGGRLSTPPGCRLRGRRVGSRRVLTVWPRAPSPRRSPLLPARPSRWGASPSPPPPSYRLAAGADAQAAAFCFPPGCFFGGRQCVAFLFFEIEHLTLPTCVIRATLCD